MENSNYLMWDFDELVGAYASDKESQQIIEAMLTSLYRFLDENACTTSPLTDKENLSVIRKRVFKNDLNADGFELSGKPVSKWLGSKKARKLNPDMSALEKALAEIRSQKS